MSGSPGAATANLVAGTVSPPSPPVGVASQTSTPAATSADAAHAVLLDPTHTEWSVRAPDLFRVRFATDVGPVVLEAHRRWAPAGVDRLYNLVRLGYYDDQRIFRVREGFIAQFGVAGDPEVAAAWYEETLPDEPRRRSNRRGLVSYASLEAPDSRTTQLFINLDDNERLDAQGFAPIGRIVEGMNVVDRFHAGYDESAGGGMRGGRQGRIVAEGNAHLDAEFPRLTRLLEARIEPARVMRFPDVGDNRIRVEAHLLPAVSTGPMDPDWAPDGSSIAFSMRGDIWVVPARGGEAVAVTRGPAYHFEPAWSPDGRYLAYSRELDGNLDIGVVWLAPELAAGAQPSGISGADDRGPARVGRAWSLTDDPAVDINPVWAADGAGVYFASARGRGFDIRYRALDGTRDRLVVGGAGHQIQPAVSPDGSALALVSPVRGQLGVGGIWTVPLPAGGDDASAIGTLVHREELSYRAEPTWSADGRSLLFVSDAAGSNDLAVVPATGGAIARLTVDAAHEYEPAASPDDSRIAFVTNRDGATRLMTAPAGGARRAAWAAVEISGLRPVVPEGELTLRLVDAATGQPTAARLQVVASDERAYAPDDGFHRAMSATDEHYFHATGEVVIRVPAGVVEIEARRGPEYLPRRAAARVEAGASTSVVLPLERLVDASAQGWYSGDTHVHDLHQGRFGLDHARFFEQLLAEDLRMTNALIHMDGTRLMGRWDDLTGEPHPLSTPTHVLQYAQEFRGAFGHVGLLGVREFVMPLIGGTAGTAFAAEALNFPYLEAARAQGGIGGFMHPYTRPVTEPQQGAGSEIVIDAALGKADFFDVACIWYDEIGNAGMYRRLLNAGIRLAATGGSDNFADVWRDPPPGTSRTFARLREAELTPTAWLAAVRSRRTFASNGPLLFLEVTPEDGPTLRPGDELTLDRGAPTRVAVVVEVATTVPLDRVDIVVNGEAVRGFDVRGSGRRFRVGAELQLPDSAWIAATAVGPPARGLADSYAYAHTSPVDLLRDGRRPVDVADARFLAQMARAWWERVRARDRFADDAARERFRVAAERAISFYEAAAGR